MELVFLTLLILLMVFALTSGFPVAFALPGSAILAIAAAALCGYVFEGNVDAYFAQDGPGQWLTAGVTNFRSLYWDVERDTLIAIPLFVFMGIMLQRSKIAEDLLVTMAQLFGPIPGGLGISVVFVGALLAATTGIVGATVIAMGLISLPAMLRNNYSKPLATGTICASGTLGQIIPPSIVLIILADQLASAADQASTTRKAEYREATGEFSMPSELDVVSASAGDMFMGAFIPGLILVLIYMAYILIRALVQPKVAPPVHYEGKFDRDFAWKVFLSLVPPLALIFAVLGSIIMGVATVNQAGAIGAVGAMIMGGYRLAAGRRWCYLPAILAVASTAAIMVCISMFDLNVRTINTSRDMVGIVLATIASVVLMVAVIWSAWRAYKIEDTLRGVMVETAKTTSMVFIILIGAAMLTSAFRAFGGEELVKEFLTGLPGGFWTQFIVVMLVIFLLGFFLDFIEIAVVVVPIVAPILLSDPSANITAVWLGVMVGLNIQTSFLTPPFGFALFYLRGVAPPEVKTLQIYRGAAAFIFLQLIGLAIAGAVPSLVNYLPNRIYLTSETAPPPMNPKLQLCLERYVFDKFDDNADEISRSIAAAKSLDLSLLPADYRESFSNSLTTAAGAMALADKVKAARMSLEDYAAEYRPLHQEVRRIEQEQRDLEEDLKDLRQTFTRRSRADADAEDLNALERDIQAIEMHKSELANSVPQGWESAHDKYRELSLELKKARGEYRRAVDESYQSVMALRSVIESADALAAVEAPLKELGAKLGSASPEQAMEAIEAVEDLLDEVDNAGPVKTPLSRARRALRGDAPDRAQAEEQYAGALAAFEEEVGWRRRAADNLLPGIRAYDETISDNIGIRLQRRLNDAQAKNVAACQSIHRDISLEF